MSTCTSASYLSATAAACRVAVSAFSLPSVVTSSREFEAVPSACVFATPNTVHDSSVQDLLGDAAE